MRADADFAITGYIQSQQHLLSSSPLRYYGILARYQGGVTENKLMTTWQLNGLRGPIPSDGTQKMVNVIF